jgi:hypothetical protein
VRRRCGDAAARRLIEFELRHPLPLLPPPCFGRPTYREKDEELPQFRPFSCEPTSGSP